MNIEKYKQQQEYECVCGYTWIDSERRECPMCGEEVSITSTPYEIKHPDTFGKRQ